MTTGNRSSPKIVSIVGASNSITSAIVSVLAVSGCHVVVPIESDLEWDFNKMTSSVSNKKNTYNSPWLKKKKGRQ